MQYQKAKDDKTEQIQKNPPKLSNTKPNRSWDYNRCSGKGSRYCFTSGTRHVAPVYFKFSDKSHSIENPTFIQICTIMNTKMCASFKNFSFEYNIHLHYCCGLLQAGILKDHLLISLEPEAASIYCQYLPTEKLCGAESGFTMSKVGSKYMIVDLGGIYFIIVQSRA